MLCCSSCPKRAPCACLVPSCSGCAGQGPGCRGAEGLREEALDRLSFLHRAVRECQPVAHE
jgi:hypothetical protein